jgi:hypothetical protein
MNNVGRISLVSFLEFSRFIDLEFMYFLEAIEALYYENTHSNDSLFYIVFLFSVHFVESGIYKKYANNDTV